MLENTGQNTN